MPRLIIQSGAAKGQELELQRGANHIGRAEGNDFQLEDPSVSGRHCEIVVTDFSVRVRDLGSTNGTYLEGKPIKEAELAHGQRLTLGGVETRLEVPPVAIEIPPIPPPEVLEQKNLPDGTPACLNHPDVAATRKCVQCSRLFCDRCTRQLRLVGGKTRVFCPVCSGACQLLGPVGPPKSKSLASRILDTIRIPFRRSEPKE